MVKNLEEAIRKAGSPVKLLWESKTPPAVVPRVVQEFTNWRDEQDEYQAVGIPPSINWLHYHAVTGGYDVRIWRDDNSWYHKGDPVLSATRSRVPAPWTSSARRRGRSRRSCASST